MSVKIKHSNEGTTTLTIKDHEDYKSRQIIASTEAMKRLLRYAYEKLESFTNEEQKEMQLDDIGLSSKEGRNALRTYASTLAKEFFEGTGLPYMHQEVAHDNSVSRDYGFPQDGGYTSKSTILPAANKIKSFFKSMNLQSIAASMGFQKALSEEINDNIDYDQKYKDVKKENNVEPIVYNTVYVAPAEMSLSGFDEGLDLDSSKLDMSKKQYPDYEERVKNFLDKNDLPTVKEKPMRENRTEFDFGR